MEKTVRVFIGVVVAMVFVITFAGRAMADDAKIFTLTIENHQFTPTTLEVPAGQKIILHVINKDNSVEEFESHSLKREKIVPANGSVKIPVGPLKAGSYEFFGEFHEATAKGQLVAVEQK